MHRSIPAWAGATDYPPARIPAHSVHPRVGGGDMLAHLVREGVTGPSPRGRGRRCLSLPRSSRRRSIPAWAGATSGTWCGTSPPRVHPRVGGGDSRGRWAPTTPRGPSPRGRGRHIARPEHRTAGGSIPAWAGATESLPSPSCPARVHPRVGGGDAVSLNATSVATGPSPRGRGRRLLLDHGLHVGGSIPAWAGATRWFRAFGPLAEVHPRVGGGDREGYAIRVGPKGPSPRGRGRLRRRPAQPRL